MIKQSTTQQTQTITHTEYYCDICKSKIAKHLRSICIKCHADLCLNCIEHIDRSTGDYGDEYYCKRCWDIGEKYRKAIAELEDQIEALEDEYSEECLNDN